MPGTCKVTSAWGGVMALGFILAPSPHPVGRSAKQAATTIMDICRYMDHHPPVTKNHVQNPTMNTRADQATTTVVRLRILRT